MPKIKVLRVIARMNVGGPAFLVKNLMEKLDPEKFDQLLVYGICEGEENQIQKVNELSRSQQLLHLGRRIHILRDAVSLYQLIRIIRAEKPQIIDTHTFKAGLLIRSYFLFIPFKRVKIVHHYHGHLLNGYFSKSLAYLYRFIERILSRNTNVLITDGILITNDLVKFHIAPRWKFTTVRPGIDLNQFGLIQSRRGYRPIDEMGKPVIAFVGRLAPIKRPDRFLAVVHELVQRGADCQYQIFGEGELHSEILQEISRLKLPIELLPFQSNVYDVLKNVDLLVITSDNEGTPLTVMQASLAGVPCVGTNVGSMQDIVIDGVNGYLVSVDHFAIADKIEELISNPNQLRSLQESSSSFAVKHFSIDEFVKVHANIYTELAKSGKSRSI
jgi:glycosyltransferase involved in cell wall biosynthesis